METIFVSKDNKQEYIEVDDFVRQGDYKYTYSDSSSTALKSEQADMVVTAAERFAQVIPLNMQEIFLWYFEQKGVDNPERFLQGVNEGVNNEVTLSPTFSQDGILAPTPALPRGEGEENAQPENQLSQSLPQNLPSQAGLEAILNLLKLVYNYAKEKGGDSTEMEELVKSMEQLLEEK